MQISNSYVVVEKVIEQSKDEFRTVEVEDQFIFKGKIRFIPEAPVYLGNKAVTVGDTILFAKYSPDTHEIEWEGQKLKFIMIHEILAVL